MRKIIAFKKGLEAHLTLNEKDMQSAWNSFHPKVSVRVIDLKDMDTAKYAQSQLTEGKDFSEIKKNIRKTV